MADTRKSALEPVTWRFIGPYWNACQGLLNDQGQLAIGAVVGWIHPAANKEKGEFWWVACAWCGMSAGGSGEEKGYAATLAEAKLAVENVAAKSPTYTVKLVVHSKMGVGLA